MNVTPPNCDRLSLAFVALGGIEGCTYDYTDTELHELLSELIYSQDPPPLEPFEAEAQADDYCALAETIFQREVPWRFAIEINGNLTREDLSTAVICPRWCKALRQWLVDNRDLARECLPDADP